MRFDGLARIVVAIAFMVPVTARSQESGESPRRKSVLRNSSKIEEIVVRARKRDENLQDVPISVTAMSADALRDAGVTRLDDIQRMVPNVFFETGRSNQEAQVRIRGVGTGSGEINFDPGVGLYVDGIYLPRSFGQIIDVVDVEQIEVLRGPQGTLFGKNTVGGAISVRTVKPHDAFEGELFVRSGFVRDFDDLNGARARVMLNIPLIEERVLSRFSFVSNNWEGYVSDSGAGPDKSGMDAYTFIGSLRFLVSDDITFDVSGTYSRDHNSGRGGQCVFVNEDAPLKNVVPGFVESCKRSEPFSIATNVHGISDVQSMGVWGGLDWDLGQVGPVDLSLRTLGSWRQQLPRINEDLDSTPQEVIKISSIGDPPFNGFPGFQQQWSYEFQVNGSTWQDRINLVSGVFAFWENGRFEPTILAGPQATPLDVNLSRTSIDNWTWALFAQGTADIWDWLSVTGGLRFTQDKKGLSVFNRDPRFPLNPAELQGDESKVYDRWTPMGSIVLRPPQPWLDSTPIERGMFYFTYAKGFKGGGFNGVLGAGTDELTTFLPEKLDNFEIGFKTTSFDDRLTLNLALFYGIYNDVQVITIQSFEDPTNPAVGSRTERVTQNADGTIQGIEVEAHAMPIDNLEMIGSFGYVDATYDDFENASDELAFCLQATPIEQCQRDRSGESFDRVPRMQASVAVQYSYAVDLDGPDWLDGYFVPRVDWSYRSDYHLLSRQIEAAIQHGYHLLGARFAYEFLDDRRAYVALWAKNLTDESYFTEATPITGTFGSTTRYFQWPRTFGLEASYRFQ